MSTDLITAPAEAVHEGPLTTTEKSRLEKCESEIEKLQHSMVKAGKALHEIVESKLYREGFDTFEDYCQSRWGMTSRNAYYSVSRYLTFKNLEESEAATHKIAAESPAVAALTKIKDPDKQVQILNRSIEQSKEAGTLEKGEGGRVEPAIDIVERNITRSLAAAEARRSQDKPETNGRRRTKNMKEEFQELAKLNGKMVRMVDKIATATGGPDTLCNGILDTLQKLKDRIETWREKKAEAAKASK
jgi:hypothetical protein